MLFILQGLTVMITVSKYDKSLREIRIRKNVTLRVNRKHIFSPHSIQVEYYVATMASIWTETNMNQIKHGQTIMSYTSKVVQYKRKYRKSKKKKQEETYRNERQKY